MNIQQNLNQITSLAGLLYTQTARFEAKKETAARKRAIADLEKREEAAVEVYEGLGVTKDYAEATHLSTIHAEEQMLDLAKQRYTLDPTKENLENIGQWEENLAATRGMTEAEKSAEHSRRSGKGITANEAKMRAEEKLIEERKRLMPGHPEAFYRTPTSFLSNFGKEDENG